MLVFILNWVFCVGLIVLNYVQWSRYDTLKKLQNVQEETLSHVEHLLDTKDEMVELQEEHIKTLTEHIELLWAHRELREGDEN